VPSCCDITWWKGRKGQPLCSYVEVETIVKEMNDFYKVTNCIQEDSVLMNCLSYAPPVNNISLVIKFQCMAFGETHSNLGENLDAM
jgi:hypothetical protein